MTTRVWIDPIDKPGLLVAMMHALATPDAQLSLEGDLRTYDLGSLEGATFDETAALRRNTIDPIQDFVVVLLSPHNIAAITHMVSVKDGLSHNSGLIHVQIANASGLAFGGYDNFHRECVFALAQTAIKLLPELRHQNIIRGFH